VRGSLGRTPTIVAAVLSTVMLVACTTPHIGSDPANAPNAVVSSLDRIRDGQTRLGGPAACLEDAWCAAGLTRVYGLGLGSGSIAFDTPAATSSALIAGAIDVGAFPESAVETGDPLLTVVRDDRSLQPADNVVPIVAGALVRSAGPQLASALDTISATLDDAGLDTIVRAIAGGAPAELAAADWLDRHPLIAPVAPPPGTPAVVVASDPDPLAASLADLYAGALEREGWSASVRVVSGRSEELEGLSDGSLGLAPEFTADLLQFVSGYDGAASTDQHRNLVLLRAALADRDVVAAAPAPARLTTVFAVSTAVARALSIASLSDLARVSGGHLPTPLPPVPLTPTQLADNTENPPRTVPSTLGVGSIGPVVATDQGRLVALGYGGISETGTYDEATRRAVAAFQADNGLIADGAIDPATARALRAARPGSHPGARPPGPGDTDTVRPPVSLGGSTVGTIYLLLADGPSSSTASILDVLAASGAKATFFAEEGAVATEPETLRSVMAAGDGVGLTMWPHAGGSPIAQDLLSRTASATQIAVSSVDGVTPTCFLAPYGSADTPARQLATALGMHVVLWDLDPQDWLRPGADVIAHDVLTNARPGSMILLHDGGGDRSQTVAALQEIVPALTSLGYNFAAIPGC